jgi:hypothetical protein
MLLPCPDDSSGERPFRQPSAELLGQCDDDAFGAADVAEPIAVLVLRQLANEFGAVGVQAGKDVVKVFDGERDATYAQRVRRCVFRFSADRRRRVETRGLGSAAAHNGKGVESRKPLLDKQNRRLSMGAPGRIRTCDTV